MGFAAYDAHTCDKTHDEVEVVEDKAVMFEKSNVEALRGKLQMLCNDEEMVSRLKAEASDFVCKKYNWDDVVKETLDIYAVE